MVPVDGTKEDFLRVILFVEPWFWKRVHPMDLKAEELICKDMRNYTKGIYRWFIVTGKWEQLTT